MDYFKRQRGGDSWDQSLLEKQVALCLGMGGLGCTVSLDCCRLGFKKIFIVDKDVVDFHNLNRQILYSKEMIGKSKVASAYQALQAHNLRTEIQPMEIDVLKEWCKIVEVSRECTVIFNMVDIGNYFDFAVQALALNRRIPVVVGGTYQTTATVDFSSCIGGPCWSCLSDLDDKDLLMKLTRDKIETYTSLSGVVKQEENPVGISNVLTCCTCCNLMVSTFVHNLFGMNIPSRQIMYLANYEIDKWKVDASADCTLCSATAARPITSMEN